MHLRGIVTEPTLYYQEKESSKINSPWLKHIAWSQAISYGLDPDLLVNCYMYLHHNMRLELIDIYGRKLKWQMIDS